MSNVPGVYLKAELSLGAAYYALGVEDSRLSYLPEFALEPQDEIIPPTRLAKALRRAPSTRPGFRVAASKLRLLRDVEGVEVVNYRGMRRLAIRTSIEAEQDFDYLHKLVARTEFDLRVGTPIVISQRLRFVSHGNVSFDWRPARTITT